MKQNSNDLEFHSRQSAEKGVVYDKGTVRVVVFACLIIVLAVVLTGGISYFITRNAVVDKLKSRDLVYVIDSIASKIDGRIARARETAFILAKDPTIFQWITGAESDERLGEYSKAKINEIARDFDYANAFIVSAVTNHYWAEGSKMIQVMKKTDPNAKWFFDALESGKAMDLNIDYSSVRKDTFVFLNALVGDLNHPVAVAGVGLSLRDIAQEIQRYKFGEKSNLWLADSAGKIHLSDNFDHNGKYLNDFVPTQVFSRIIQEKDNNASTPQVIEYVNANGEIVDLAFQSTKSTDWKLVFQIPRNESIEILGSIKMNTVIAAMLALLVMVFVFYVVSRRIADPLKRALILAKEMEKLVGERTKELADKESENT